MPRSRNEIAIWFSLGGYSAWVVGDTFVKLASETLSTMGIMSVVLMTLMIFIVVLAALHGGITQLATRRPLVQFLSATLNTAAGFGAVIGVTSLSLANFYTIIFSAPLIVTMLAWLFLKEKADWKIWAAIVFGFLGILVAVRLPGVQTAQLSLLGVAATLVCAIAYCCAQIMVRAFPGETNYALSFWPRVMGLLICAAYFLWTRQMPSWPITGTVYGILGGIMSAAGVLLTNLSLRYAPVAVVSPYHYTQIIGGAIIGYLIWHNVPSLAVVAGAIMVAASGLFILKHQRHAAEVFVTEPT